MGKGFRHTRSIEVSSGNGRSCPSFRTSARHGRGAQPLAEIDIDQVAGQGITGFGSAVGRKPADRRPYRDPWKQLLAVPRAGPSSPLTGRNPEGHRSSTQWCVTFRQRAVLNYVVFDRRGQGWGGRAIASWSVPAPGLECGRGAQPHSPVGRQELIFSLTTTTGQSPPTRRRRRPLVRRSRPARRLSCLGLNSV